MIELALLRARPAAWFAACSLVACSLSSVAFAQDGDPPGGPSFDPLRLVPEDALFVARIPDVDGLRQAARANTHYRFLSEPDGLARSVDEEYEQLRIVLEFDPSPDELAKLEPDAREAHDLAASIDGSVTKFLQFVDSKRWLVVFGAVLSGTIVVPERPMAEVEAVLQGMAARKQQALSVFYRDGFRIVQPAPEEEGELIHEATIFAESWFAHLSVSSSASQGIETWIDPLLASARAMEAGEVSASVLDNPIWNRANGARSFVPQAELWINVQKLWEAEKGSETPDFTRFLGLDGVEWIVGGARLGPDEVSEVELAIHVPRGARVNQLLDAFGPLPLHLLERFPLEAGSVTAMNIDPHRLFQTGLALSNTYQSGLGDVASDQVETLSDLLGVDLEEDVLAQIPGPMAAYRPSLEAQMAEGLEREILEGRPGGPRIPLWLEAGTFAVELYDSQIFADELPQLVEAAAEWFGVSVDVKEVPLDGESVVSFGFGSARWAFEVFELAGGALMGLSQDRAQAKALESGPGEGQGLLEHPQLGPLLRSLESASWVQAGLTAETYGTIETLLGELLYLRSPGGSADRPTLLFSDYFSGITANSWERFSDRVRFYAQTR